MVQISQRIRADNGGDAQTLHIVDKAGFEAWRDGLSEARRAIVRAARFSGGPNELVILPGDAADDWSAALGVADTRKLTSWCLAKAAEALPAGEYRLADGAKPGEALLGWMLGQYRFDRYRENPNGEGPRILLFDEADALFGERVAAEARATIKVRDLVNTPAQQMGPAALEAEAQALADAHGGKLEVTTGAALEQGYPMIHAVGRAAADKHAPRLIELHWGEEDHPRLALVGKGVCFDSGGLDIKTAAGMRIMKKDMGGSAHVLALAGLIMEAKLPVRLHMLVSAVENAISGDAFRPGDILTSRKGISVEIDNTDAEGRLVLGDALTRANESEPELMIDFATLTGAARVALGPDLPAMFANNDTVAAALEKAGRAAYDPMWRLPLWSGYADMLSSDVADCKNSGGSFAGSVTAALFLQKFADEGRDWVHFDTYAWRPSPKPGQPAGGEALGLRATWRYLQDRYATV